MRLWMLNVRGNQKARVSRVRIGVIKESFPGERRVSIVPAVLGSLKKKGLVVAIETGAGGAAGYPDSDYESAGASIVADRRQVANHADVLLMVRGPGANPVHGALDLALTHAGQILVGLLDPLGAPEGVQLLAERGVTAFALELVPRITRAQSMDALSSMAGLVGYKAVLLAASAAPRIFPMMMTPAGTIAATRVLVLGAGVAGLSAIATAKRLGAIVEGYDVRPEVREQIQSVGGRFVDLGLDTHTLTDNSGYAKAQSQDFATRQQEALSPFVRLADVVITTAQVPGRRAPTLVTAAMMKGMKAGSVIVDLAAEQGGNCVRTKPGTSIEVEGVTVLGPLNLAASMPFHASQLYAKNITTFLLNLLDKEGHLSLNTEDEIVRQTLVAHNGEIASARVREAQLATQKTA